MDREATANIEIKKKANRIKHTTRKIKKRGGKKEKNQNVNIHQYRSHAHRRS